MVLIKTVSVHTASGQIRLPQLSGTAAAAVARLKYFASGPYRRDDVNSLQGSRTPFPWGIIIHFASRKFATNICGAFRFQTCTKIPHKVLLQDIS